MNRSNGSHVYIENVEPLSEGTYSCEINTDEPFFMSMQAQQDLRVYGKCWRIAGGVETLPGLSERTPSFDNLEH